MTRSPQEIHRLRLLLPLLILAGCASTQLPLTEVDEAAQALTAARAADSGVHAPMEIRFAEERLVAARQAIEDKDGARAAMLADQVLVNTELAMTKARAARIRAEVRARSEQNAQMRRELLGEREQP